jgi:hypothetical protein
MRDQDAHLSDQELMLAADDELSPARSKRIHGHLAVCLSCCARLRELERASLAFSRTYHQAVDRPLPPTAVSRARLRARLTELNGERHSFWGWRAAVTGALTVSCALALLSVFQYQWSTRNRPAYVPSSRLTPGVARAIDREELCHSELPKNQLVTAEMRRRVFAVYGISNADPQAYEVDYLITPALGGADDIRNLWPQPYSSTAWNARVKDALEDRLRELVCRGQLDLAEAQRDISTDWIAAYKKYFQTTVPQPAGR